MNQEKLVAACGLFCGACEMYRADHDDNAEKVQKLVAGFNRRGGKLTTDDLKCDGCMAGGRLTPWCKQCAIRECTRKRDPEMLCSDCKEYPCSRITDFNNDGMQHHSEVLENLQKIKAMGLDKWIEHEEERWTCPQCQNKLSWYDETCSKCGVKKSAILFPLKAGQGKLG